MPSSLRRCWRSRCPRPHGVTSDSRDFTPDLIRETVKEAFPEFDGKCDDYPWLRRKTLAELAAACKIIAVIPHHSVGEDKFGLLIKKYQRWERKAKEHGRVQLPGRNN